MAGVRQFELDVDGARAILTHSDRQWLHRSRDPSQSKLLSLCLPKRRPMSAGAQVAT
jgi:hypothetical protein